MAIVNETISELCSTVETNVARNYAQIAADKLIQEALQNHRALHTRDVIADQQDMTVLVIPLNVERVVGVPDIHSDILYEKTLPLWIRIKNRIIGSSEDIFKIADWNTSLRWRHERQSIHTDNINER